MENYGALISTLVLEKLPNKIQDGKNGAIFDLLHTFFLQTNQVAKDLTLKLV